VLGFDVLRRIWGSVEEPALLLSEVEGIDPESESTLEVVIEDERENARDTFVAWRSLRSIFRRSPPSARLSLLLRYLENGIVLTYHGLCSYATNCKFPRADCQLESKRGMDLGRPNSEYIGVDC
jgi:hypothetical protein